MANHSGYWVDHSIITEHIQINGKTGWCESKLQGWTQVRIEKSNKLVLLVNAKVFFTTIIASVSKVDIKQFQITSCKTPGRESNSQNIPQTNILISINYVKLSFVTFSRHIHPMESARTKKGRIWFQRILEYWAIYPRCTRFRTKTYHPTRTIHLCWVGIWRISILASTWWGCRI